MQRVIQQLERIYKEPKDEQKVEVLIDGVWKTATFHENDWYPPVAEDGEEVWWREYFRLDDGTTYPEDIQQGLENFPEWRAV